MSRIGYLATADVNVCVQTFEEKQYKTKNIQPFDPVVFGVSRKLAKSEVFRNYLECFRNYRTIILLN